MPRRVLTKPKLRIEEEITMSTPPKDSRVKNGIGSQHYRQNNAKEWFKALRKDKDMKVNIFEDADGEPSADK
jgi:hypothetical protein